MPIPPAGPARAVLTRARRREAEPSASPEPEARVRPAPERSPEAGVRFTRTPDHVLQARQRRREQALREKEEAQRAAEAEAAARAAAELAAAEAAQAEAEAARIEAEAAAAAAAVPIWRQPFVLPPGVRFTRTPDHLLRHSVEEPAPVETAPPHDTAGEMAPDAALPAEPLVHGSVATEALPADPIVIEVAGAFPEASPLAEAPGVAPEAVVEAVQVDSVQVQAVATEPARFECVSVDPTAVEAAAIRPLVFGPACVFGPAAPEPAAPAPVSVEAAATFDEPDAAILVPVDVSHLRSLPPRPVYALDRLLQHDWTHPLSTSLEQDNRPLEEPAADEPVAVNEAPAAADLPVEAVASVTVVPEASPVADTAPEVVAPAMLDVAEQSIAAEPVFLPVQDFPVQDAEAVATVEDALADLPPATILLPAPAPMLALTYAPLADAILLPAPSAPEAPIPALPLLSVEAETAPAVADEAARLDAAPVPADIAVTEAAPVAVAVPDPAPVAPIPSTTTAFASTSFSSTSFAFAPVPWSFIAADAQPLGSMTLSEPLPSAPAPAEPAPAAAPQAGQPFVYVPTGRLNAQPPAPTLPSPARPPRIILPVATQPGPAAAPSGAAAAEAGSIVVPPEEIAPHSVATGAEAVPYPMPAAEESVASGPHVIAGAWSPAQPIAEPHGLVIGTTGLAVDLGLDADDDAEDEDDILAPVATIPLRQAARFEVPYELPSVDLLAEPRESDGSNLDPEMLEDNALQLQQVIQDFGVRGEILAVRPGPVVTLYEMEPAPGTKSSRVISLADDIARSMSAISARVAVVQGRNAIGIELPNLKRETVYLRELLTSPVFTETKQKLALCLGKNIGGEAIIADLARMPHLLVAGTTGSGKSVAINTMILSLLYRLKPEECRLIMVDPKMLELSVYDGIPHLLSPVVTDPKKAVIALKWAVREMEERYKKMARLGVRNIDGFNARVAEARARGEVITRTVQTGFDRETGEAVYEDEVMDLSALPYIVIVVDEMADLMMVAGKDIEGAIQRLAQMARAAGLHLIMATQRPSVDVITGTIKANFPTRISFQVTSKIDSRTILGEMGAEQLLGQGDMLFMAGGGRTTRVHGPFCSDDEVEQVVAHLKRQGRPSYLEAVTADEEAEEATAAAQDAPVMDQGSFGDPTADLYDQAVAVVLRDKKASTSYIQRRLQIGYNRAASLMERMEREGIVGPANHAGKREILIEPAPQPGSDEA
nr:DNA translocase FtsK [Methylobacterium indicum]